MIENANITRINDNGFELLVLTPNEGFKLRHNGDNTYSTMLVAVSASREHILSEYIAVPIDEPDEEVEEAPQMSEEDDNPTAEEASAIITRGTVEHLVEF